MLRKRTLRSVVSVLIASALLAASASVQAEPLVWNEDMQVAWKNAQEKGQPLLLFVSTEHCSYCERMKRQTFQDKTVIKHVSEGFVAVAVDAEKQSELVKKLRVRLLPTTVIVDVEGRVVDSIRGFQTAEQLHKRLMSTLRTAKK